MKNDIKNIILKSLLYELDDSQKWQLQQWIEEDNSHGVLYDKLKRNNDTTPLDELLSSIDTERALKMSKNRIANTGDRAIRSTPSSRLRKIVLVSLSSAASLFLLFVLIGVSNNGTKPVIVTAAKISNDAYITLSTGEVIDLENDAKVKKTIGSSEISVNSNKISIKGDKLTKTVKNNVLNVPHGKNYNITLSDGTRIWINALSELKFPAEFGETRVVELTGEAFFDVAKDSLRPFIVKVKGYDVVVKGTSFNISNYADEDESKTTLCTGVVEVLLGGDEKRKVTLQPNNQLTVNSASGLINIEEVYPDVFTSWRDGNFYFVEQNLDVIFKSLSKWYDIEGVDFESEELKEKRYSGKLLRTENFVKVLEIIEKGSDCMIVRDGNRLQVMKRNKR